VKWIYAWYGPDKAKKAARALIDQGCDALAYTEDTPAVLEVGQEYTEKGRQIYTFSHYTPMQQYGPDSVVSGQIMDWGVLYLKILTDIQNNAWKNEDMLWLAKESAALLGASHGEIINPKFVNALKNINVNTNDLGRISAYDLVVHRYAQMKKGDKVFEPFTGPIQDNEGQTRIMAGHRASKGDLLSMAYYVDNVDSAIPR